ncbi:hypothetical protein K502DRAFT_336603, partial [Neoconidiobolus thromboides FSU 785]
MEGDTNPHTTTPLNEGSIGIINERTQDNNNNIDQNIIDTEEREESNMIFRRASQTSQPLMDKASIATTNTRYGAAITSSDESNQQVEANGNLDEDGLHSPHYSYPPQNVQNRNSYAYIPVSRQGSDEDLAGLN